MDKFRKWLRDYLEFTEQEVRGSFLLLLTVIFFMLVPIVYRYSLSPAPIEEVSIDIPLDIERKIAIQEKQSENNYYPKEKNQKSHKKRKRTQSNNERFPQYVERKPAQVIIREPFIYLNSADTSDLKKIKGIGNVFAQRIVKYRNRVWGFVSTAQLKEVYGLPPETIEALKKQIVKEVLVPNQYIKINQLTFKELLSHGYLDYSSVKKIANYRDKHEFNNLQDVYKSGVDSLTIQKIELYLKF